MSRSRRRIKVLICSKFTLFRDGIKVLFGSGGPIEIAGEAATGTQSIDEAERLKPDVVLLDVDLPDLSGFATMHRILSIEPGAKIFVFSLSREHRGQIARCLESGAAGFIRRKDKPAQLEAAILSVAGRRYAPSAGAHYMMGGARRA